MGPLSDTSAVIQASDRNPQTETISEKNCVACSTISSIMSMHAGCRYKILSTKMSKISWQGVHIQALDTQLMHLELPKSYYTTHKS